jgi:3-oxoacyl-[acyl-carrier protein] reductase
MQMKEQDFDEVIAVNLKGAFNMIKHTARRFAKQKSGRIINISSVSGLMGNSGQANYSASKAGMIGLTKTVAKELASRGVTCNAIAPGFIDTDMTGAMPESAIEAAVSLIPQKKMGKPEDIAALSLFLASDEAGYITGEIIRVDGGLYI